MSTTPLELLELGTLTLEMAETTRLVDVAAGTRAIVELSDVTWRGERLSGRRHGTAAGDWIAVGPTGIATLDLRFTLATEDGAIVYVHGSGRVDATRFRDGAPTYFAPLFETADPRYAWLNRVQGVARGELVGNAVVFSVYEAR